MRKFKYNKEIYPKIALIKAAYNFTDKAYLHLDADQEYYYVTISSKEDENSCEFEDMFENEILAQCVRHEIYLKTKNIRELMLARAVATSVIASEDKINIEDQTENKFTEEEILKDWFTSNE